MRCTSLLSLVLLAVAAGCASPEPRVTGESQARRQADDCVRITGTHVCKRSDIAGAGNTQVISGDALRRGGPGVIAEPNKVEPTP